MAKPDRLAKSLVEASLELYRRRSWKRVLADAPFLIQVPTEDEPLVGILIGQDGTDFGLVLVRGSDALGQVYRGMLSDSADEESFEACDYAAINFDRLSEVPVQLRGLLNDAGFQTRRENIAPYVFVVPPHSQIRGPSKRERKTMLWCLRAVCAAEDLGGLQPRALVPGDEVLGLTVTGKLTAPEVKVDWESWTCDEVGDLSAPALLPADLAELPRLEASWCMGLVTLPVHIEEDDRLYRNMLLVDMESRELLEAAVVPGGVPTAVIPPLLTAFRERGLPRELLLGNNSLSDLLAPGLAALEVRTQVQDDLPALEELREEVVSFLLSAAHEETPAAPPVTLDDWKCSERSFIERCHREMTEQETFTPRAYKRYFGSEEMGERVLEELEDLAPMAAFFEWLQIDYRPTKRSKTWLERFALEEDLDETERAWVESRRTALLSVFRVVSTEPGVSLELEDLLNGGSYSVQEQSLSACGVENAYLILRLSRVGDWWFPSVAGPVLPEMWVDRALSWLEDQGLTLDAEGLRRDAHLVGRLWGWVLNLRGQKPVLQNTDGDALELHSAEFHIADPNTFATALERCEDVEIDQRGGSSWVWGRPNTSSQLPGDFLSLAHLELLGDKLVAEVNSAPRFQLVREWLEGFEGVSFAGVSRREFDGAEPRPLDDRLPGPVPEAFSPEMQRELEKFMLKHAMGWLDESVPALGGLTPRAACATKSGRRKVSRLIRTMPAAKGPVGEIPPPREALLRELGLDEDV